MKGSDASVAGEPQPDCLFCKIVSGDVPATIVRETDTTVAFRDINPQAPTHVLVIPREHHPDAAALVKLSMGSSGKSAFDPASADMGFYFAQSGGRGMNLGAGGLHV